MNIRPAVPHPAFKEVCSLCGSRKVVLPTGTYPYRICVKCDWNDIFYDWWKP